MMKMVMLLVVFVTVSLVITPTTQMLFQATTGDHAEAVHRFRRRINKYKGQGPIEYMKNLRASMTNEDGSPKDVLNDPTSTWCLMENDVSLEQYHSKPKNRKCSMEQKFRFNLKKLSLSLDDDDNTLSKALFRVYLQPIKRLMPTTNDDGVDILVNISARAIMNNSDCSGETFVSSHIITVTSDTQDHWEEWNITDGFSSCWSATNKNVSFIEFTVHFQKMQCFPGKKKIPIEIVDPAVIPMEDEERRKRHWPLQPFVLVFLDNEEERKKVISESAPDPVMPDITNILETSYNSNDATRASRQKRGQLANCNLTSYHINFQNLGVMNILVPAQYNARMCRGDCSKRSFSHIPEKVNNHARLIAHARSWYDNLSEVAKNNVIMPENTKCVGTSFNSLTVTVMNDESTLSAKIYPAMSATRCGCRT